MSLVPFERALGVDDLRQGMMAISGASRRLGSPGDEREGLTEDQIRNAIEKFRQAREQEDLPKTLPDRIFRKVRESPF